MVRHPRHTLADVVTFLGEAWIERMEHYGGDSAELENVERIIGETSSTSRALKQPIFTSSVGQWRSVLSRDQAATTDEGLFEYCRKLGYAT